MSLDPELLNILRCPACKGELAAAEAELTCAACALAYPIENGIPVLLTDAAKPIK